MALLLALMVDCNNSSVLDDLSARHFPPWLEERLAVGEHHGDGNDEDADDNPRNHGFSPELEVDCSNTDAQTIRARLDLPKEARVESRPR